MREASAKNLVLAPVLLRGSAFLIDLALVLLISTGLIGVVVGSDETRPALVVILVTLSIYHIVSLAAKSATPGKSLMNIYVAYPDGSAVRPDTAILRSAVLLVDHVLFLIALPINLVMMMVDRDRRVAHDRVAGTIVLAGRAGAPLRPEQDGAPPPAT